MTYQGNCATISPYKYKYIYIKETFIEQEKEKFNRRYLAYNNYCCCSGIPYPSCIYGIYRNRDKFKPRHTGSKP